MAKGRGYLSAIDKLPEECEHVVSWAAHALADRERTQVEIYGEFKQKLIAIQGEQGLDFDIPSFSAFNRYSIRLSNLTRRLERSREIASTVYERSNGQTSDETALISGEMIKAMILEIMEMSDEGGLTPKATMELAQALKAAVAAQATSSNRLLKLQAEERAKQVEADLKAKAEKAIDILASEPGISKEAIARARREFLGVRPKKKKAETDA